MDGRCKRLGSWRSLRIPIVGGSTGRTPTVQGRFRGAEAGELEGFHNGTEPLRYVTCHSYHLYHRYGNKHYIFGTFRLQCLQSTTREAAHMNLNTALMSHLQKPPMALKITLITFMIHPIFLFAFNFNLLQRLQLPGPCQRFP